MKKIAIVNPGYLREQGIRDISRYFETAIIAQQGNPYLLMGDQVLIYNKFCSEEVLSFLKQNNVDGILTYNCSDLVCTANIADKMGFAFMSVTTAEIVTDKAKTRQFLREIKKSNIPFAICNTKQDVISFSQEIGFPFVVKPTKSSCSLGVSIIRKTSDIEKAVSIIKNLSCTSMIAEGFIKGCEYSAEIFSDGKTSFCVGITEKTHMEETVEMGHIFPANLDIDVNKKIIEILQEILNYLDNARGVFHIEFKFDKETNITEIVEINGRVGGDFIPFLVQNTTGINLDITQAKLAVGEDISAVLESFERKSKAAFSGIRFAIQQRKEFKGFDKMDFLSKNQRLISLNSNKSCSSSFASNALRAYAILGTGETFIETKQSLDESIEKSCFYLTKDNGCCCNQSKGGKCPG